LIKNEFLVYSFPGIEIIVPDIFFRVVIPRQFIFFIQAIILVNGLIVIKCQFVIRGREVGHFVLEHLAKKTIAKHAVIIYSYFILDHSAIDELL
jgi:hypothetical protein